MATFITVEQDGSELLRRNQEQAQAARLAKLEGDEQARTEKEAKRQRQAELQRQGLDASGNALGDSRRRQPFRRDEPAASFLPGGGYLLGPDVDGYVNGGLPVRTRGLPVFSMSKHGISNVWVNEYQVRNFLIVQGPAAGTRAITKLSTQPEPSINYLFASNFAPSVGVDLANIIDLNGALQFDPISRGSAVLDVEPLINPAPLADPRGVAGKYRSHTFEFIIKLSPQPAYVMFNGFAFALTNVSNTEIIMQAQRITGIASNPTGDPNHYSAATREFSAYIYAGNGTPAPSFIKINPLAVGQWVHVALSKSDSSLSLYINGKRVIQAQTVPNYWELFAGFDAFSGSKQDFSLINGQMPLMCMVSLPSGNPGDIAVHGIRFTPRALYTGAEFTPPTSITQLA